MDIYDPEAVVELSAFQRNISKAAPILIEPSTAPVINVNNVFLFVEKERHKPASRTSK